MPSVPSSDQTPLVAVLGRDIAPDNLRLQYNSLRDRARSRKGERQRSLIQSVHSPKLAVVQYDVFGAGAPLGRSRLAIGANYTTFDRGRRGPAGGQSTAAGNDFSAGLRSRRGSRATTADACASAFPAGPTACASRSCD